MQQSCKNNKNTVHVYIYNVEELNLARTCIIEKESLNTDTAKKTHPIGGIPNKLGGYYHTFEEYLEATGTNFEDLIKTCIRE